MSYNNKIIMKKYFVITITIALAFGSASAQTEYWLINTTGWKSGLYIVQAIVNDKVISEKIQIR